jgi:hypothetical protein
MGRLLESLFGRIRLKTAIYSKGKIVMTEKEMDWMHRGLWFFNNVPKHMKIYIDSGLVYAGDLREPAERIQLLGAVHQIAGPGVCVADLHEAMREEEQDEKTV